MGYDKMIDEILLRAYDNARRDPDISLYAEDVKDTLSHILSFCAISEIDPTARDAHSMKLLEYAVSFGVGIGGSASDYCADAAENALVGYALEIADLDGLSDYLVPLIDENALDPNRCFDDLEEAGIFLSR